MRRNFLQQVYKDLYPKGNPIEFSDYLFDSIDYKSKGYITFREFCLALNDLESDQQRQLKLMFKVYDLNHNKKIERNELSRVIKAIDDLKGLPTEERTGDKSPDAKADKVLERLGKKSKKSVLNEDEFIHACLNDRFIFSTLLISN